MSISHHPPDLLLAEYASGTLAAAPGLIVSAHVDRCAVCGEAVRMLEEAGGAMLDAATAAPLAPGALERALERLDQAEPSPPLGSNLPYGARVTFPGGASIVEIRAPASPGWTVLRLSAPAGAVLPAHDPSGLEYACVLEGAVSDGVQLFQAGDFAAADADTARRTVSVIQGPCTALLASQGLSRWRGLRVARP